MFGSLDMSVREVRSEMGLSQSELAGMAGISTRAIQSYEQKWRKPSEMVERMLLLLLIAHRNGAELSQFQCWSHKECSPEIRDNCSAYATRQGHLCWFLTGTMCECKRRKRWDDKLQACLNCSFMQVLLELGVNKTKQQSSDICEAS